MQPQQRSSACTLITTLPTFTFTDPVLNPKPSQTQPNPTLVSRPASSSTRFGRRKVRNVQRFRCVLNHEMWQASAARTRLRNAVKEGRWLWKGRLTARKAATSNRRRTRKAGKLWHGYRGGFGNHAIGPPLIGIAFLLDVWWSSINEGSEKKMKPGCAISKEEEHYFCKISRA